MVTVYLLLIFLNNEPIEDRFNPVLFINKKQCEHVAYKILKDNDADIKSICKPILIKSTQIQEE
tara:strand:+ start:469 stop:660 length:192 start_codon:yes stop_codon:yes gene_type:complete